MLRAMRPTTDDVFRRYYSGAQFCEPALRQELSRLLRCDTVFPGSAAQKMPAQSEAAGQADAASWKGVASSSNAVEMSRMLMTPIRL